jgi:hypothetical protein
MKTLNVVILTVVTLLVSTTVAGVFFQQLNQDAPYIPQNLEFNLKYAGGITIVDMATNQTIISIVPDDHIDVYTTHHFQSYTYKAGDNVTIPLYLKFISSTKNSTTIVIDPKNPMSLHCYVSFGPNKGGIMINDYLDYTPEGVIKLQRDELVKVTLTMEMPKGLWPYDWQRQVPFNLYGVDGDVPMVLRFNWEIDV